MKKRNKKKVRKQHLTLYETPKRERKNEREVDATQISRISSSTLFSPIYSLPDHAILLALQTFESYTKRVLHEDERYH